MLAQSYGVRFAAWTAACLGVLVLAPGPAEAQQTSDSGEFTIKATFDTWWLDETDPDSDYRFSASGAIRDKGTFEDSTVVLFHGQKGDFYLDGVPGWAEEGVEYPVVLLPGTGAYADVHGIGILTAQIRYRTVWYDLPWGGRERYTYPVVTWTIDGVLIP